jgi:hypothetical protein
MSTSDAFAVAVKATADDTAIKQIDKTKIEFSSSEVLNSGKILRSTYVYADGDAARKSRIVVEQETLNGNAGVKTSIKLFTYHLVTVDSEPAVVTPANVQLSWTTSEPVHDVTNLFELVLGVVSLTWDSLSTKVPQEGNITKLNFGLLTGLFG